MVWKLRSDCRRPCDISAWYGVYAVYQPGFSSMFRRITGGTVVSLYPMPMKFFITCEEEEEEKEDEEE